MLKTQFEWIDSGRISYYHPTVFTKNRDRLLVVDAMASTADGRAEREVATVLLHDHVKRRGWPGGRLGPTKASIRARLSATRGLWFTPDITQNTARAGSAIDHRTTRHARDAKSQHARPRIEPAFGWLKTVAWLRKVKLRGLSNVTGSCASRRRRSTCAG